MSPSLGVVLGTAGYGRVCGFESLQSNLQVAKSAGCEWVDSATNYPINGRTADFRRTISLVAPAARALNLGVIAKVGSLTNSGTGQHDLSPTALTLHFEHLVGLLGSSLGIFAIHWDDRNDVYSIRMSLQALREISDAGTHLGLSGISRVAAYASTTWAREYPWVWQIRARLNESHQVLLSTTKIRAVFPNAQILGYGLFGGLPSNPPRAKAIASEQHCLPEQITGAWLHGWSRGVGLSGIIIGTTSPQRIDDLLRSWD